MGGGPTHPNTCPEKGCTAGPGSSDLKKWDTRPCGRVLVLALRVVDGLRL